MTTGIASGLGATFGMAAEVTPGTFVTPARWIPHTKADFQLKKSPVVSQALRGSRFLLAGRRNILSFTADGSLELDLATKQFGLLWQMMLGSTPVLTQMGSTAAWLQTHSPGLLEGQSFSVQKGVPQINGTIQATSYNGCKITDWTISVARGGLAKVMATVDSWNEVTATSYTAATYLSGASAPSLFDFSVGSLLVGGAISFNTATLSTSSGTAPVGEVSGFTIKGANKFKTDRFNLGSQIKKEQISNAFTEITGEIEVEFANLTDYYNAFAADTTEALFFSLVQRTAIAGSNYPTLQLAIPAAKFEQGPITETGTDVIIAKVPFTAYDDGAGDPVVQLQYMSTDTAV